MEGRLQDRLYKSLALERLPNGHHSTVGRSDSLILFPYTLLNLFTYTVATVPPLYYNIKPSLFTNLSYAMSAPLQIEWTPENLDIPDAAKALIVKEPHSLVKKAFPQYEAVAALPPMPVAEFFRWMEEGLLEGINWELQYIQANATNFQDEYRIQFHYLQQATLYMMCTVTEMKVSLETAVKALQIPAERYKMDWEWTPPPKPAANLDDDFKEKIKKGEFEKKAEDSEDEEDRR